MARILIADDEDGLREFLSEVLEDEGHDVSQATNGHEAVAQLEKQSFDLLVTDLRMPGLDGIGVLKQAKQIQPDMRW